jgi:hypothetical protein
MEIMDHLVSTLSPLEVIYKLTIDVNRELA